MLRTSIPLAGILLVAWACSTTTPPPAVSVMLTPNAANVHVDRSIQFTATVHNSTNAAVTWSVSGVGCGGATCGMISSAGLYTAPANVPSPAAVTVKVTSAADTSKSASATITLLAAVVITVSPPDPFVTIGATRQFRATVENAIDNGVTWTVWGSACTGSECGTISTAGLYTAPSAVPAVPAVLITATSVEDTAMSGSTTATIKSVGNEWTWVSGSEINSQRGIYGTKGIAGPLNVPGSRGGAVSWLDPSGNLWTFGGSGLGPGISGVIFNDLWTYNVTTHQWTWVSGSDTGDQAGVYGTKGVADPLNVPGSKGNPLSWRDPSGKLWLFGGMGLDLAGYWHCMGDLWFFDPTTSEWTWVSGSDTYQTGIYGTKGISDPSNIPGGRYRGTTWIDAGGKLWLFGGWCFDSIGNFAYLNDLWAYDPATDDWTWMSGSHSTGQAGIYGTKGVAAPSNIPGARVDAVSWLDSQGKFWLFGGSALDSTGTYGYLNDLWQYDPATSEWTWESGSNIGNQAGIYGTKGITDPSSVPGGRAGAVSWIDSSGMLWLFGGGEYFNDLWKYDTTTHEWTWVSGSDMRNQAGIYGTKSITDPSNVPGARAYAVSWVDSNGLLWLWGGGGVDSANGQGCLNDLWYYIR